MSEVTSPAVLSPAGKLYTAPTPSRAGLDSLFLPRSAAVIGATDRAGTVGRSVVSNLLQSKFPIKVYAVNPSHGEVLGIKTHKRIGDIAGAVDLALVVTPAQTVPQIIGECVDAGVKSAVVISAGFREQGPEGAVLEDEIRKHLDRGSLRLIGPNCMGFMNPTIGLNATFAKSMPQKGSVAFLSQSGALQTSILDWSQQEQVGFSTIVSTGSMLDVGWGDLIYHFGDDPHTKSILLYMESVGDARSFLSAAREIALSKPIIVIKAGRSEAASRAAASHTGALTGSDDVLDAAFRRCGVLRVQNHRGPLLYGGGTEQAAAAARSAPHHRDQRRRPRSAGDRFSDGDRRRTYRALPKRFCARAGRLSFGALEPQQSGRRAGGCGCRALRESGRHRVERSRQRWTAGHHRAAGTGRSRRRWRSG